MSVSSRASNAPPDKSSTSLLSPCSVEPNSPTSIVAQVLYETRQQAIRCRLGWTRMECMCLIFDLSLQHTMWVGCRQVCLKQFSVCKISADLISLWRQRLEEDLAGGENTLKKCLIMFGMHSEGTGTCDLASLQRKFF